MPVLAVGGVSLILCAPMDHLYGDLAHSNRHCHLCQAYNPVLVAMAIRPGLLCHPIRTGLCGYCFGMLIPLLTSTSLSPYHLLGAIPNSEVVSVWCEHCPRIP